MPRAPRQGYSYPKAPGGAPLAWELRGSFFSGFGSRRPPVAISDCHAAEPPLTWKPSLQVRSGANVGRYAALRPGWLRAARWHGNPAVRPFAFGRPCPPRGRPAILANRAPCSSPRLFPKASLRKQTVIATSHRPTAAPGLRPPPPSRRTNHFVVSMSTAMPLFRRFWPVTTTRSPSVTPETISYSSPMRRPSSTLLYDTLPSR